MSDPTTTSDLLFDGACSHGLIESPLDGFGEPRIAAQVNGCSTGVDAGYEVVRDAQDHLLGHPATVADLIADSRSDSMTGMTMKPITDPRIEAAVAAMDGASMPHSTQWPNTFRIDYPGNRQPGVAYRDAVLIDE